MIGMTQTIIDLVGIALFANWLTHWFSPLSPYRDRLVQKMVTQIVKANILWAQPLLLVFTCAKCLTFWGALIYTQNFFYALVGSLIAQVLYYIIKKTNYVE
jgi:hypothetical protein